jgi:hypothetical protein
MAGKSRISLILPASFAVFFAACGEEEVPPPPPPPTQLGITVVDATTALPITGAEVTLIETGDVKVTDAAGEIFLDPIEAGRYTFRAQAEGYVLFPRPRADVGVVQVIKEETTEIQIALEPRPNAMPGGRLEGTVTKSGAPVEGVLITATALRTFAAYSDKSGRFAMLGVDPSLYSVTAFIKGHSSSTVNSVDITAGAATTVDLTLAEIAGASVSGQLIGGTGTSSVTIVHRGSRYAVPGLVQRAQFGGSYAMDGIPPGDFEVFAAAELDGITFDPQWVLENGRPALTVGPTASSSTALDLRFASAIAPVSPTNTATVVPPVTFTWPSVQDADRYVFEVRNVLGEVVYGGFDVRKNPINPILGPASMYRLDNATLARGQLYTWRVFALRNVTTGQLFEIISASEELGGELRIAR